MFGAGVSKKWSQIWTLVDERERGKNMPGTRLGERGFMRLQKVETKTLLGHGSHNIIIHCGGIITHFILHVKDIFLGIYYCILTTT